MFHWFSIFHSRIQTSFSASIGSIFISRSSFWMRQMSWCLEASRTKQKRQVCVTGWWQLKHFLIFTPKSGEMMIQFGEHIFQMGGLKPPTTSRLSLVETNDGQMEHTPFWRWVIFLYSHVVVLNESFLVEWGKTPLPILVQAKVETVFF